MIPPTHRLRCCLLLARLQVWTRLGGEPLTLGHRGRHSYGSQGRAVGRGKADTRMVLLRPASNHRILPQTEHCSTPWPTRPVTSGTARPTGRAACSCKVPTTRGDSGAPTGQRGTRGGTHAGAEGVSRRPETMMSPMRRPGTVFTLRWKPQPSTLE